MTFLKTFFCVIAVLAFSVDFAFAQSSIAGQASELAQLRSKEAEIKEKLPQTGQSVADIGYLTITDFLKLSAVEDGLDAESADLMYRKDSIYDSIVTGDQMLSVINQMQGQNVELDFESLKKEVAEKPEKRSELLNKAFENMVLSGDNDLTTKEKGDQFRRDVIRKAEETLGIDFRSILKDHQRRMTPKDDFDK